MSSILASLRRLPSKLLNIGSEPSQLISQEVKVNLETNPRQTSEKSVQKSLTRSMRPATFHQQWTHMESHQCRRSQLRLPTNYRASVFIDRNLTHCDSLPSWASSCSMSSLTIPVSI